MRVRCLVFRVVYTIWRGVSTRGVDMGRQRPRPTTCSREQVLVVGRVGAWSTHIVIGTTGLAIVRVVLLGGWVRVGIARVHVVEGWLVDDAGWVPGFVDG